MLVLQPQGLHKASNDESLGKEGCSYNQCGKHWFWRRDPDVRQSNVQAGDNASLYLLF